MLPALCLVRTFPPVVPRPLWRDRPECLATPGAGFPRRSRSIFPATPAPDLRRVLGDPPPPRIDVTRAPYEQHRKARQRPSTARPSHSRAVVAPLPGCGVAGALRAQDVELWARESNGGAGNGRQRLRRPIQAPPMPPARPAPCAGPLGSSSRMPCRVTQVCGIGANFGRTPAESGRAWSEFIDRIQAEF